MNCFRVIGLRILQGCDKNIRKILKENTTYFFYDGYEEGNTPWKVVKIANVNRSAISHLYDVEGADQRKVSVNISALVGKNGDGKSTIVEVILRILNNFAFILGYRADQDSLRWVQGLRAALYAEVDGRIYTLVIRDGKVFAFRDGQRLHIELDPANHQANKKTFKKFCEDKAVSPFYTMVINYSIYAYNSNLMKLETKDRVSWIDELFHKNDSYQTPVVLNPMREDDSIDIQREERLCRQRMMAMFTLSASQDKKEQMIVNKGKVAVGFAYSLSKYSKFFYELFDDFYRQHGGDAYSWQRYNEHVKTVLPTEEEDKDRQNLINCVSCACKDLKALLSSETIQDFLKPCRDDLKKSFYTDMSDVFVILRNLKGWKNWNNESYANTEYIDDFMSHDDFTWLNYAQLYRLALVHRVWDALVEKYQDAFDVTFDEAINKRETNPRCATMLYAVYKVISIAQTYRPWKEDIHLQDHEFTLLEEGWSSNGKLNNVVGQLMQMLDEAKDNYITLKFRQAINYLRYNTVDYDGTANATYKLAFDYDHFVDFKTLYKSQKNDAHGDRLSEIMPFLPPPSLDGDIILKGGNEDFTLSSLSSGELQMINTVSSLVYHLRNLDDNVAGDDKIQYKNVNVVLEEVELYFHPDYQKQYVRYLLDQIERTQLKQIEAINILFVTHSPFILSDIVRSNILCLKGGKVHKKFEKKTFGANIYDLLRNPFFLSDGTIGDYSQEIINRILVALDLNREPLNLPTVDDFRKEHRELANYLDFIVKEGKFNVVLLFEDYDENGLWNLINLIDEPFIKNALKTKYFDVFPNSKALSAEITLLEARLKELRGE